MRQVGWLLGMALGCTFVVGCGAAQEDETTAGWRGSSAHLSVQGTLDGEKLDIVLEGEAAADTATLWCERRYEAPPDASGNPDEALARPMEMRIGAVLHVNGTDRILELELKQHDFQADSVPAAIAVIPRVDTEAVPTGSMWLEWEWHSMADEDLLETAAQTGTFDLELFEGEPAAGGVMIPQGEGAIGGFVSAKWAEDEELEISFTAPCTEYKLEVLE